LPTSLQEELVKYFVGGATAWSAALLTDVNRHTATLFFRKLWEVIPQRLDREAPEPLGGEVKIDESYFGGRRKGKTGARRWRQGSGLRIAQAGRQGPCGDHPKRWIENPLPCHPGTHKARCCGL
jgi:hypothetical protein